ncbi:MAG: radical SAM protein [Chloroflexi bacterium]|nr:radical SAM protein [Chloroflexota bacterium]
MEWRQIAAARALLEREKGWVKREWGSSLPVALAYPNTYRVGMSSLALHGLYTWLNELPGVVCERAFASYERHIAVDEAPMTLESQQPLREAAILAFTLSFEPDYFHLIAMLRAAGVPVRAEERAQGDPLVLLGGPAVSANPEPLSAIADAVLIGEAEEVLGPLLAMAREGWQGRRDALLRAWAALQGVYVPTQWNGAPVARRWVRNLDDWPLASTIIAPDSEFGDMHLIEIARGCGHGCRFCLAGTLYRPPREHSLASVLEQARRGLERRRAFGLPAKLGLVSAAVSDYGAIDELVARLGELGAPGEPPALSVSSLRIAPLSLPVVRALRAGGSRTITLAPEAGSERLRRTINKCVTHDDILAATDAVARERFETVKLYFMVGLPGEQDADIDELVALAREVKGRFPRNVVVNVTPFVPKAHTPFERAALTPGVELNARLARLRAALRSARIELRAEGVDDARAQAILARGDRALGDVLTQMPRPSGQRLERALQQAGLDVEAYVGARPADQALPWDVVDSGMTAQYRARELRKSIDGELTAPCPPDHARCRRCGVCAPDDAAQAGAGEDGA